MKIGIMCSLAFSKEAGEIKEKLVKIGHIVSLPYSVERILKGEITVSDVAKMKNDV